MVFFCCDECGESLKKNQVEKHKYRCRSGSYSCLDCQLRFTPSSYASHIKCITENQKYGGKGYVEKVAKGEAKQKGWVELVQGAIENVNDAEVKRILQRVQDFDNIPRKEAKFINFIGNSLKIHNKNLCQRVWAAISEETEKMKRQVEEEKKAQEAAQAAEAETSEQEKKEEQDEGRVEENGSEAPSSEVSFKWKSSIKRKLKEAGGEMKVKRLRKAVIADYEQAGGDGDTATELFEEKLKKSGILLAGKVAQLA